LAHLDAAGGCSGDALTYLTPGRVPDPPKLHPAQVPARYKAEIADFMRAYLTNPTKVKDAYVGEPALKPVDKVSQYVTCVRYNSRDRANQYQGNRTNLVIFLGGRLVQFLPEIRKCAAVLPTSAFRD